MIEICSKCKGSRYGSAAKDSGTDHLDIMDQQIGIYPCTKCGGAGEMGFIPPELTKEEIEYFTKVHNNDCN